MANFAKRTMVVKYVCKAESFTECDGYREDSLKVCKWIIDAGYCNNINLWEKRDTKIKLDK